MIIAWILLISVSAGYTQSYYIWRQSSWKDGVRTSVSASCSNNSTIHSIDGSLFLSGNDSGGNGSVLLKPTGVISPMFANRGEYLAAGFNIGSTTGTWSGNCVLSNTYDERESVDGNGSYRAGIYPYGLDARMNDFGRTFSAIYYKLYNPLAFDGQHPLITTNTNLFLFFFFKYNGYAHPNSPHGSNGGTNSLMNFMYFLRDPASYNNQTISNMFPLCAASNNWRMITGQFKLWASKWMDAGKEIKQSMQLQTGFVSFYEMSGLSNNSNFAPLSQTNPQGQFVGHTYWLDQVIAAHSFHDSGSFISSPIAVPRYLYSGGTVQPFVSLDGIAMGGIQGMTNTFPGNIQNSVMSNTNINAAGYMANGGQECMVRLQIRSGNSLTALLTNAWYGAGGAINAYYSNAIVNSEGQSNDTSTLPASVKNGLYFQYRAVFSSSIQGATPVLTNVYLFFKYNGAGSNAFDQPFVFSHSMTNISSRSFIIVMSNYYDPVNTRIYAFNQRRPEMEASVDAVNDHLQAFSVPKTVYLSTTTLPADKYSLKISNNGNPNVVILTDVLDLGGNPTGSLAIDTSQVRRAYIPLNNRIDIPVTIGVVGTRTLYFDIYDTAGRLVQRSVNPNITTGPATLTWAPARSIGCGVYLYRISLISESGTTDSRSGMFVVAK